MSDEPQFVFTITRPFSAVELELLSQRITQQLLVAKIAGVPKAMMLPDGVQAQVLKVPEVPVVPPAPAVLPDADHPAPEPVLGARRIDIE